MKPWRVHVPRFATLLTVVVLALPGSYAWAQESQGAANVDAPAAEAEVARPAAAQSAVPTEFASPRDTIETFLLYANQAAEDDKNQTAMNQLYRTMDVTQSAGTERANMAVKLLGFFNALGKFDGPSMAPGPAEVEKDRLSRFEFFPDNPYPSAQAIIRQAVFDVGSEPPGKVVLVRTDSGEWKFAGEALADIGKLWSWIEVRGVKHGIDIRDISATERLRDKLIPQALKGRFILGFELWQWAGLVIILFVAVVIDRATRIALRPAVRWLTIRAVGETEELGERATLRPMGLLVGILAFVWMLKQLGLVGQAMLVLVVAVKLIFIFSVAWTAWALTDLLARASLHKTQSTELTIDNMIIPLLRRTAKLVILVFALIYVAHALDINLLPLLGSLGIAGLAISFAAQDMVKNLFGGATVFLDRPFKTGDRVKYGGYDGFVEYIGFRSTKVKTFSGHTVTIPNGLITGEAVENVSTRTTIMRSFSVKITYDTPPEKVEQAVQIVRNILDEDGIRESINPVIDDAVWEPLVKFDNFNADSLNLYVIYWFEPPSWYAQMDHAQRLNLRIFEEFRKAGIEFALPTQTVRVAGDDKRELALKLLSADLETAPPFAKAGTGS